MNARVTLSTSPDYARPRFHPGQILPDTQLTMLSTFAAANLRVAARRHGWGIVRGLVPKIVPKDDKTIVQISPGDVVDQTGNVFVIEKVTDLETLILPSGATSATQREAEEFDLWLIIAIKPCGGGEVAWRNYDALAPMPKGESPSGAPAARPPREQPEAHLELRPAAQLNSLLKEGQDAYDAFAQAFDQEGEGGKIEQIGQIQERRLKLLANELLKEPPTYDGIPLGRIRIDLATGKPKGEFDAAYAHTEARDELPAPRHRVNIAPVLGMEPNAARAWLAVRGFPPWTVLPVESSDRPNRFGWDLALRPGDTVRLFTYAGRVAVAKKGPSVMNELARLWNVVVFLGFALFGLILVLVAHWIARSTVPVIFE